MKAGQVPHKFYYLYGEHRNNPKVPIITVCIGWNPNTGTFSRGVAIASPNEPCVEKKVGRALSLARMLKANGTMDNALPTIHSNANDQLLKAVNYIARGEKDKWLMAYESHIRLSWLYHCQYNVDPFPFETRMLMSAFNQHKLEYMPKISNA